ncbi:MAG: 3-dehydroquinate synthase [uncultured bacterium]|nr:MAG: 3-dehydroquinate synthase [uncultured bacterium]
MKTVKIKLRQKVDRSYPIWIETGLFKKIPADLKKEFGVRKYAIVTDTRLEKIYGQELIENMQREGLEATIVSFALGEKNKSLATIEKMANTMLKQGHNRQSMILTLGGGITGDLGGFLASIYMRGIDFVHVPTSLLAMADSCIGGKNGVDLKEGKNLLGTFLQPKKIYMDPYLLSTLSPREIRNGLAEVVKHGFIADAEILKHLTKHAPRILEGHLRDLTDLLVLSCRVKGKIIELDPTEEHERKWLNYGHSLGHAIEQASGYKLHHGEAIAIGMNLENRIAFNRKMLSRKEVHTIETLLQLLKLPTEIPLDLSTTTIVEALKHDKKNSSTQTYTMVLLKKIGSPKIVDDIQEKEIQAVLSKTAKNSL